MDHVGSSLSSHLFRGIVRAKTLQKQPEGRSLYSVAVCFVIRRLLVANIAGITSSKQESLVADQYSG